MRIVHMIEGEVVKKVKFKSTLTELIPSVYNGKYIDLTASKFLRRVKAFIEKKQYFVEAGLDGGDTSKQDWGCYWTIFHTGDNCLKVYPEGFIDHFTP